MSKFIVFFSLFFMGISITFQARAQDLEGGNVDDEISYPRLLIAVANNIVSSSITINSETGETRVIGSMTNVPSQLVADYLVDHFVNNSFYVFDSDQIQRVFHAKGVPLSKQDLLVVARGIEADVVVTANIDVEPYIKPVEGTGGNLYSSTVLLSLKAYRTDNGFIFASTRGQSESILSSHTQAKASREATSQVLEKLVDSFSQNLLYKINSPSPIANTIRVEIGSIESYEEALHLKEILEAIPRNTSVEFRDYHKGKATYDIVSKNSVDDISLALIKMESESIKLEIISRRENTLEIEVKR